VKPNIGSGDEGKTNLIGKRVWKDDLRVEVNGSIDELNSFLGLAKSKIAYDDLKQLIEQVQRKLFLAAAMIAYSYNEKITHADVKFVEENIEALEKELEPLNKFIIPSGEAASIIHICRTKCRQAERLAVKLFKKEKIDKNIVSFLNRLSDLLFVLARVVNKRGGIEETKFRQN